MSMASDNFISVTDDSFDAEVLQSAQPVLVDYWAEWCAPCKSIEPILNEISESYRGRLKVAKVDTVKNQRTPAKYAVRALPTLMIFKGGKVHATKLGAVSKSQLTQFIDAAIA
jgi:thioredoxin 1